MKTRYFALVLGILYAIVGVLGFIPPLLRAMSIEAPNLLVNVLSGRLLGIFPVNLIHTIVHLGVGIWGIVAYRSFTGSIIFAKSVAIIFGILAIMGLVPYLQTTFGLVPLWGSDVILHALTALVAAYFGFIAPAQRAIEIRR